MSDAELSPSSARGLWIDPSSTGEWEAVIAENFAVWMNALSGNEALGSDRGSLRVEIFPPGEEELRRALTDNLDLLGRVRLHWRDYAPIEVTFPFSWRGVFLSRRPERSRPLVRVWSNWLAEAPGFRWVRPTNPKRRREGKLGWRVGLPGGYFLHGNLEKLTESQVNRLERANYFGDLTKYPDWMRPHLAIFDVRLKETTVEARRLAWAAIRKTMKEQPRCLSDEDDLEHRILVTFPVWLSHRLPGVFLRTLLYQSRKGSSGVVGRVLGGFESGSEELARTIWASMGETAGIVGRRLHSAILSHQSADQADWIDPINPLDLASRINRVRRIQLPASELKEIPAIYRQNHPSFRSRLCPVDSPESEQVGLTLHLATGASVGLDGRIRPAKTPASELGFGARLVPFFDHNDGARNMMGAKNLRQAVPLRKCARPVIESGGEQWLQDYTAPFIQAGICPDARTEEGTLAFGRDLLVAYLPWFGMNFEDAIVIGSQVTENGWLDLSFKKSFHRSVPLGWEPADPPVCGEGLRYVNGLIEVGSVVHAGTPLPILPRKNAALRRRRM